MTWVYLLIAVALLGLLIVVDPVVLLCRYRLSDRWEFEIVDPVDDATPAVVKDLWHAADRQFGDLGFEAGPRLRVYTGLPGAMHFAVCYRNVRTRDTATACVVGASIGDDFDVMTVVELKAELIDGSAIVVNNATRAPLEPRGAGQLVLRFPRESSVTRLYRLFQAAVSRHAAAPRRPWPAGVWWEVLFRESISGYLDRAARHGLMCPTRDGSYRLTLRGAFMSAWLNAHPIRYLLNRRLGRRERELLWVARL